MDACRQIKRTHGSTAEHAGVFREGIDTPDISCPVEAGALLTVSERDKGGVRFEKYIDLANVFNRQPDPTTNQNDLVPELRSTIKEAAKGA